MVKSHDAKASALRIIAAEHKAFDAALAAIVRRMSTGDHPGRFFDPLQLDRSLATIATFMESFHHPKEDDFLFKLVRERTREADDVLAVLHNDHLHSPRELLELRRALAAVRPGVASTRHAFSDLMENYARRHLEHMRLEDHVLIPIARRVLSGSDWATIDAAFRANRDPLYGSID